MDELTQRDRDLLDDFIAATKWHGWAEDQGSQVDADCALAKFLREVARMEHRLATGRSA